MKTRVPCLLLASLSLVAVVTPPGPVDAAGERLVLAFYYAWYDMSTWQKPLSDQPTQPYMSADPAAIERHVVWARQAGIDAFVQSWYGPQAENNQTEANFAALLDIAARHGFAAAVDLEVSSPFIQSEQQVVAALQHLLAVHAAHPAYLRVDGRPVVFFWHQDRYSVPSWQAIRDQVDPQRGSIWIAEGVDLDYLGPFDGNHLYSVAWDAEPEGTLTRWGQRIREWSVDGGFKFWVATVMPGYDDRATGRSEAFVRERADGVYYRRCWDGAVASGADWVLVTSFNEWMEGTQIEPSTSYGDFYLNLTRELGDAYRASEPPATEVPPPATVSPTDTPLPSPAASPTLLPTPTTLPTSTATPTTVPTATETPLPTPTSTSTPVPTAPPTATPTVAPTPGPSPTPTAPERVLAEAGEHPELVLAGFVLLLLAAALARFRRGGSAIG
jgi:hypothetical protein